MPEPSGWKQCVYMVAPWSLAHSRTAAATFSAVALSFVHDAESRMLSLSFCFTRYLAASLPRNLQVPYMPRLAANEICGSAGAEGGGLLSWLWNAIESPEKTGASGLEGLEAPQPCRGIETSVCDAREGERGVAACRYAHGMDPARKPDKAAGSEQPRVLGCARTMRP